MTIFAKGNVSPLPKLADKKDLARNKSHLRDEFLLPNVLWYNIRFNSGVIDMGDKGSKDKGKREQQKKAQLTPKEKRQAKRDKKNK